MPQNAPEQAICQAVLDFASECAYPESEDVAVSEVPASCLSKELELISKAREQVEVNTHSSKNPRYLSG